MTVLLEYVTFGWSGQHLLQVLLLQFIVLFVDLSPGRFLKVDILGSNVFLVALFYLYLPTIFVILLSVFVYSIGVRTFAPRFHRLVHLVPSMFGYLFISGCVTVISYLIVSVIAADENVRVSQAELLNGLVLMTFFAMFLAVGYLYRIMSNEHPTREEVLDTITAWIESLEWVEEKTGSHGQKKAYEDFWHRTDELSSLLSHATTLEGRKLYEEFREWQRQSEVHSMLHQGLVITDERGDNQLEIFKEHKEFDDIRTRLESLL